jgi:hypothetical protein
VLARSINTSLVAILPVLSVLVIGAQLLGATTLQSFGLALVIGLTSGAYSSIFIASPVLASLKEREPRYKSIRSRLMSRSDYVDLLTPKQAALMQASGGVGQGRGASGQATTRRSKPPSRAAAGGRSAPGSRDLIRPAGGGGASQYGIGNTAAGDTALEEENARLRAELEALRSGAGVRGASGSGSAAGAADTGSGAEDGDGVVSAGVDGNGMAVDGNIGGDTSQGSKITEHAAVAGSQNSRSNRDANRNRSKKKGARKR